MLSERAVTTAVSISPSFISTSASVSKASETSPLISFLASVTFVEINVRSVLSRVASLDKESAISFNVSRASGAAPTTSAIALRNEPSTLESP